MLFIEFIKRRATVIIIVLFVLGLVGYLTCGGITYKAYTSIQSDEEWKKLDYFAYEKLVSNYSGNIDNIKSILQEYESTTSPKKFPNPMRFREVDSEFGRIFRGKVRSSWMILLQTIFAISTRSKVGIITLSWSRAVLTKC